VKIALASLWCLDDKITLFNTEVVAQKERNAYIGWGERRVAAVFE